MLGPIIGQSLYVVLNYELTFYVFGVVLAISMGVLMIVIPSHINHADDIPSQEEIDLYFERLKTTERNTIESSPRPIRSSLKASQTSS
jgi:hypothetical protein